MGQVISGSSPIINQTYLYQGLPNFASTDLKDKILGDFSAIGKCCKVVKATSSLFEKIEKARRTTEMSLEGGLGAISRNLGKVGNAPCLVEGVLLPFSICDIGKGVVKMIKQVGIRKPGKSLGRLHVIVWIKDKDEFTDSGLSSIRSTGDALSQITGPCEALALFGVSALEGTKWIPGLGMAATALSVIPLTYNTVNLFRSHNLLKEINRQLSDGSKSESENVKNTIRYLASKTGHWLKIRGISSWYRKSIRKVYAFINSPGDRKKQLIGYVKGKILLENIKSRIKKHRRIAGLSLLVSVIGLTMLGLIVFVGITNPIGLLILSVASLMTAIVGIGILVYKTRALRDPIDPTMVRAMTSKTDAQWYSLQEVVVSSHAAILKRMREEGASKHKRHGFKFFASTVITEAEKCNVESIKKFLDEIDAGKNSNPLKGHVVSKLTKGKNKVVKKLDKMSHSENLFNLDRGRDVPLFKLI